MIPRLTLRAVAEATRASEALDRQLQRLAVWALNRLPEEA